MFDFFAKIGEIISNIFGFFHGIIDGITGFVASLQAWWDAAMTIISLFPPSVVAVVGVGFVLLIGFIVVEILRDFL